MWKKSENEKGENCDAENNDKNAIKNYVKVKVKRKENYGVKFLNYLNHFFIFNEKGRSKLLNKVKKRKVRNKSRKGHECAMKIR